MKAYKVINELKAGRQDELLSAAEFEMFSESVRLYGDVTDKKRLRALDAYMNGTEKRLGTWMKDRLQIITNGYSAIFLYKELKIEEPWRTGEDLTRFLRESPGDVVNIIWMDLYLKLELHKGTSKCKSPLYIRVGDVLVNAKYLADARMILGGSSLRLYSAGPGQTLQLESENGKAVIMHVPEEGIDPDLIFDVTLTDPEQNEG